MTAFRGRLGGIFVLVLLSGAAAARAQQPDPPPVSLDRIQKQLQNARPEPLQQAVKSQQPVATFRSSVQQRAYMLTALEQLRKDFELNEIERQSAEWASQCCGIRLGRIVDTIDRALERRAERKTREQIARELAAVEAAAKKREAVGAK